MRSINVPLLEERLKELAVDVSTDPRFVLTMPLDDEERLLQALHSALSSAIHITACIGSSRHSESEAIAAQQARIRHMAQQRKDAIGGRR